MAEPTAAEPAAAAPTSEPRGRGRRVVRAFGWIFFAVAALGAASYFDSASYTLTISIASFAPYLMAAAAPALLLFVLGRRWIGAVLSVALLVLLGATTAPLFVAREAPAGGVAVRILTVNARLGQASAPSIVAAARAARADLVMVEELTPALQQRLVSAGLTRLLPRNASRPSTSGGEGTGLWSRYRFAAVGGLDLTLRSVAVRLIVPGVATRPTVVALHVAGPFPVANSWVSDMRKLPDALAGLPDDAPVIVAGDFNATHSIGPFRALLTDGYADAAAQAGAGLLRTYPSANPVIGIDHVLTRGAVGTEVRVVPIAGTDHRGLVATVALPRRS